MAQSDLLVGKTLRERKRILVKTGWPGASSKTVAEGNQADRRCGLAVDRDSGQEERG